MLFGKLILRSVYSFACRLFNVFDKIHTQIKGKNDIGPSFGCENIVVKYFHDSKLLASAISIHFWHMTIH